MALEGLVQWTQAVISQAKRVAVAKAEMASALQTGGTAQRHNGPARLPCEISFLRHSRA
jgi:hypothetical protein